MTDVKAAIHKLSQKVQASTAPSTAPSIPSPAPPAPAPATPAPSPVTFEAALSDLLAVLAASLPCPIPESFHVTRKGTGWEVIPSPLAVSLPQCVIAAIVEETLKHACPAAKPAPVHADGIAFYTIKGKTHQYKWAKGILMAFGQSWSGNPTKKLHAWALANPETAKTVTVHRTDGTTTDLYSHASSASQ